MLRLKKCCLLSRLLAMVGYEIIVEKFTYPRIDGTYYYQTKRTVELFFKPFGLIISSQKKGVGKTVMITKEKKDEFKLD